MYILKKKNSLTHTHPPTATHPKKTAITTTKRSNCIVLVYRAINNNYSGKKGEYVFII